MTFTIAEGHAERRRRRFRSAACSRIDEQLVREQLELSAGQPLDLSALAKSRRNLYDTGAFSTVRIDQGGRNRDENRDATTRRRERPAVRRRSSGRRPSCRRPKRPPPPSPRAICRTVRSRFRSTSSFEKCSRCRSDYGASYDTERGLGGILDVSQHNWLGGARVIGLQARVRPATEGRPHLHQPAGAAPRCRSQTTGSIYFREDLNPPTEITRAFNANRKGASIQQEVKLLDSYVWSWGYRYERARTFEPVGTAC